jgi:hypothetical protein
MALWKPGQGYAICFDFLSSKPVRRWSKEAKASVRRRNLRRRLERGRVLRARANDLDLIRELTILARGV